uniref:Uncharacterized protein n=1 Tax=Oryza nivara TaxID=4536 RepID=A0A0E0H4U1_ORYNI
MAAVLPAGNASAAATSPPLEEQGVIEPLTWEEPWEAKVAPPSSCHTSGEADGRLALAVLPAIAATSAAISSRPLLRWKIKGSDLRRTPSTAGGAHERRRRPQRKKARSERCALRGRWGVCCIAMGMRENSFMESGLAYAHSIQRKAIDYSYRPLLELEEITGGRALHYNLPNVSEKQVQDANLLKTVSAHLAFLMLKSSLDDNAGTQVNAVSLAMSSCELDIADRLQARDESCSRISNPLSVNFMSLSFEVTISPSLASSSDQTDRITGRIP